ncbi:hypothetical protein JCM10213_003403 [Rhodosporidiobolus nylandii]
MAERSTQARRTERRASPYSRPQPQQPAATPSRLRSLLSYVSPFRSASQPARSFEVEAVQQDGEAEANDEDVKQENEDESTDEAAQFALHGRSLLRDGADVFGNGAPASPSPAASALAKTSFRSLATPLSASASLPNLAAAAGATPRSRSPLAGSAYSGESAAGLSSATHELARFFQEKAERGEEHLTPVEQAGVLQLMQQAQTESTLPTAFTPNFRTISPPRANLPFPGHVHSALPASPSASSIFNGLNGGAPSEEGSVALASVVGSTTAGTYKRRRPLYVGAGYSSRRRNAAKAASGGMSRSQSESSLSLLSSSDSTAADGKRRRTDAERTKEEEDIPVASLDDVVAVPSPVSKPPAQVLEKPLEKPKPLSSFSRFNAGTSTPSKPSPLWQVSQADSPTPPRKSTSASAPSTSTASPAPAVSTTPKTAAADLMLGIIRAAEPAPSPAPSVAGKKVAVDKEKQAILNPYGNEEEDLLAGAGRKKERVPRSRAKVATPSRARRSKAVGPEKPKEKAPESPLEQLERTMPAEYRPQKRTKPTSPAPAPTPVPAKEKKDAKGKGKSKKVEVVELSSSDVEVEDQEEDQDEAMMQDEEEEEDQLEKQQEQEEEEEQEDEDLPAPSSAFTFAASKPTTAAPSSAFSFTAPAAPKPASAAAFGGFSFAPSAPPAAAAPSFPAPAATKPEAPKPAAAFSFSVPPSSSTAAPPADAETKDPNSAALALPRSALPLSSFTFSGVLSAGAKKQEKEDSAVEAVKALAREMGRGELPSFAF